jgi:two-component system nitrate/nitrite response regulator NarL
MNIAVYSPRPIIAAGVVGILLPSARLVATWSDSATMLAALRFGQKPDLIVMDGPPPEEILKSFSKVVMLCDRIALPLALQYFSRGVMGILPTDCTAASLADCLESVMAGETWAYPELVGEAIRMKSQHLSPRERSVVEMIAKSLSNKDIANRLDLTEGTVKVYLSRLFAKLGVGDRFALYRVATQNIMPDGRIPEWIHVQPQ